MVNRAPNAPGGLVTSLPGSDAPVWGQYPLVASKMTPPANRLLLGYGPAMFLGVYDTRPELAPWQPEVHRTLQPKPMEGGATFRWQLPRQTVIDAAGAVQTLQPSFRQQGCALTLYVGGLDVVPPPNQWRGTGWPGIAPGSLPFTFSKATPNVPSLWQMGLAFQRPTQVGQQGLTAGNAGQYGINDVYSGFDYLRLISGVPALDLLSYGGASWHEADLVRFAGGCRYVAVWLRAWWSRSNGVDPWTDVNYHIPFVIAPGKPYMPLLKTVCAYPMIPGPGVTSAAEAAISGASYTIPIHQSRTVGAARIVATHNGDVGDGPISVALTSRLSGDESYSTFTLDVQATPETVTVTPYGGALRVAAGYNSGAGVLPSAFLFGIGFAGI